MDDSNRPHLSRPSDTLSPAPSGGEGRERGVDLSAMSGTSQ
jgi:hypothetical protein